MHTHTHFVLLLLCTVNIYIALKWIYSSGFYSILFSVVVDSKEKKISRIPYWQFVLLFSFFKVISSNACVCVCDYIL